MNKDEIEGAPRRVPDPNDSLRARCRGCGHMWVVAYLPMRLERVATLCERATCPNCAADDPVVCQDLFSEHRPGGRLETR